MRRALRIDISGATVFKVLAAVVGVWLWLRLWQWMLLLLVAIFLAVGLDPLVVWLDAHRIRRAYAAPLVVLSILLALVGFGYLAGSSLVEQAHLVGGRIWDVQQDLAQRLPPRVLSLLPKAGESNGQLGGLLFSMGQALMSGLLSIGIALVLTVYLLLDGRRTYEWFLAFAPPAERPRVRQTASEARTAILAYVRGNIVTSVLAAVCAYAAMLLLKVPAALLLALLTGILDLIPVLGIILSTVPAILLALTVSPWVAAAVAGYHAFYNVVENYYITPKVYGSELRLSSLVVIGAFAIGGELGGVVGALVALPIAAMYPAVERLWLGDRVVDPATIEDHQRIESSEEH